MDNRASSITVGSASEDSGSDLGIAWFEHGAVMPLWSGCGTRTTGSLQLRRHSGLSPDAMNRVQLFINEHIEEPFTLEQLAKAVGMSRFHFAHLFRQTLSQSPMQYILELRIERAKQMLLENGDRTIAAIASDLGFCDQSHFTRSFRRRTGMTPGRFARQAATPDLK